MSSSQKRNIARRNGAKAAGTKSPAGIKISSLNATKHGLTAKAHVLSNESQEDFDYLRQQYINRFLPQDSIEMDLIDDMVGARWRLRRIAGLQTAQFELQMSLGDANPYREYKLTDQPKRLATALGRAANQDKTLELLIRYETTYSRMYDRAMKALERLRKEASITPESEPYEELRNDPESPAPPESPVTPTPENEICETNPMPAAKPQTRAIDEPNNKPKLKE